MSSTRFDFPLTAIIVAVAVCSTAAWLADLSLMGWVVADREAIAAGELWRLLTGPFVHATWGHLFRDLIVVAVIGIGYERPLRPVLPSLAVASLVVPTAAVLLLQPHFEGYFGLSGMSHCWIAAAIAYEVMVRPPGRRAVLLVVAASFAAKLIYEQTAGPSVIPTSLGALAAPAPLAHLAGAVVAVALVVSSTSFRRPSRRGARALGRR